jgi:hypothetical protein
MTELRLDIRENDAGAPARIAIIGSDGRAVAAEDAWMHADDGFDRSRQSTETNYFHCVFACRVLVPVGAVQVWVQRGFRHLPWRETVTVEAGARNIVHVNLVRHDLPSTFGSWIAADLHVHMNYGGTYRHVPRTLALHMRAEDLDAAYNTIVNKEERIPDIAYFHASRLMVSDSTTLVLPAQEYHTSFWGHLGLLQLSDHYLTPDFSAYQHTAFASPYPHNGVIADLARAQGALVGYVHPFDIVPDPAKETITNMLPADVAAGKVDYIEVVGFSDHKATAAVWYRLLNLGFRLPAGAGTDAMANYASLRGPVGMNRVFLDTGGKLTPEALREALKAGRTFATNGPLLGLEIEGAHPGAVVKRSAPGTLRYRIALRSFVAVDHLELVHNGQVIKTFDIAGDRRSLDAEGEIAVPAGGWILLRAWNDGADPLVLDIYPYATTSPVYLELPGGLPPAPEDAAYFAAWMQRVIEGASARTDYNTARERDDTLQYLRNALEHYRKLAR